jgi:hypothetical protein
MRRNTLSPSSPRLGTVSGYDADLLAYFYPDIWPIFSTALTNGPERQRSCSFIIGRTSVQLGSTGRAKLLDLALTHKAVGDLVDVGSPAEAKEKRTSTRLTYASQHLAHMAAAGPHPTPEAESVPAARILPVVFAKCS